MMYQENLTHIYGLDIAIEAFGMAHNEMPMAALWILGEGPETGSLEALSRKLGLDTKVKFLGCFPPKEIPHWLSRCDVGVLATRRDIFLDFSFSNKLPEYIMMGKAVISSRLKTIRHYFGEESLAFFEPNDPADLARQMVRMYRHAELRVQLVERAKREYAPIRWEVMKQRYLEMMRGLVETEHRANGQFHAPVESAAAR